MCDGDVQYSIWEKGDPHPRSDAIKVDEKCVVHNIPSAKNMFELENIENQSEMSLRQIFFRLHEQKKIIIRCAGCAETAEQE